MLYIPGLRRLQRARRAVLHPDRPHTGPLMPSEVGRPMFLDRVALDSPSSSSLPATSATGSRASRGERERVQRSWRVAPRSALLARQLRCADDQAVAAVWQEKDDGSVSRVEVPLSRHLSDSARDAVRGGLDRIVGKMRIPGSGVDPHTNPTR